MNIDEFLKMNVKDLKLNKNLDNYDLCSWWELIGAKKEIRKKIIKVFNNSTEKEINNFIYDVTVYSSLDKYVDLSKIWNKDEFNNDSHLILYLIKNNYIKKLPIDFIGQKIWEYPNWIFKTNIESIELEDCKEIKKKNGNKILNISSNDIDNIFEFRNQGGSLIVKKDSKYYAIPWSRFNFLIRPCENTGNFKEEDINLFKADYNLLLKKFEYEFVNVVSKFINGIYSNEVEFNLEDNYSQQEYRKKEKELYYEKYKDSLNLCEFDNENSDYYSFKMFN